MKTSTITFSAITLLLLIVIGFGAWTLSNQPGEHNQQKAQDSSSE